MRHPYIVFFVSILFIALLALGGWFVFSLISTPKQANISSNPFASFFPSQTGVNTGGTKTPTPSAGNSSTKLLEVRTAGGSVMVKDFTKSSDVASSTDNFSVSYPKGTEPGTLEAEYQIYFFPFDKSILVSILKEPIGEIRRKAADDLAARLGVSAKDLCKLVAEVDIPRGVNDFYTGMSLGFPGCPGATKFEGDPVLN